MSKVITLENLEVFKQECDKAYASKEEIITATVDCSHKYEITGNTGDEHGLAIDDQQMLIKKIQGHSRRKSLNLISFKPGTYAGVTLTYDNASGIYTFNGTSTGFSIPLKASLPQGTKVSFIAEAVSGTKTGAQNDISVMIDGTWIATDWVNTKTLSESISGCWMSTDITYTNYKVKINVVEGTFTNETMPLFQPYDNTLVNSNNQLISTGRNILNPDEFGAKCQDYNKVTGIAKIYASRENDDKILMPDYYFAPNTQYTFIFKGKNGYNDANDTNDGPTNLVIRYTNGTSTQMFFKTVDTDTTLKITSTKGLTISSLSILNQASTTTLYLNECAIIKGANQDYEPYKEDIIQAPSLGEFDYYQEGKIYRQTSQIINIDGVNTKTYAVSQNVNGSYRASIKLNKSSSNNSTDIINNKLEVNSFDSIYKGSKKGVCLYGHYTLVISIDGLNNVDEYNNYLKSNPIQLVYKLVTPTIINDGPIPNGMAVYNGGLQIQQGDVPYTITKQYNLSQKAQILANIEVDREQQKQIDENNQKFNLIPKFSHVDITLPETSMNGTLTEEEFKILQANDLNYIMFNKEIYMLSDKTHTIDTLTYSHVGYENHKHMLKTISVTVSTRAWVLNTTEIMTGDSGSDTDSLLGVWVLNETINHNVSSYKSFIMTFNSNGIRSVDFRLASDNRIFYEQYPIGGVQKTIEVYNSTSKWNTKTPSYRSIQITDISALNTEDKITLATFLKANAVKAQDFIIINQPSTATNGTLTQEQLTTLQINDLNYIIFNNEIYSLNDKTHTADTLTYSHVGFENGKHLLKTISITVSTRAWVLNTTSVVDSYEYRMFKINNPSDNISTSIKEIYIYTNKFDTASRFQDFLQNAYDGDMIFAFPCIAITPTDTIINAQFFYDLNIDPSSYLIIFNDKSEYVAHQNLVVVESA